MRKIVIVTAAAAAAVALALSGCSSSSPAPSSSPAAGCTQAAPGALSDSVKVSGDLDTLPTTTFPTPLSSTETQTTTSITGTGDKVTDGSVATVDFTLYNGTTGAQIVSTTSAEDGAQAITMDATQTLPGIVKAISCATVGSRVVAVIPPVDAWGEAGNSQIGVGATDTVVFVADIKAVGAAPTTAPVPTLDPNAATKATGADQPVTPGLPTVTLAADGTPTVTIPAGVAAPTTLQKSTLKLGTGATVASGDTVIVQYVGVNYTTGAVFDQSWGKTPATFQTGQVIPGFTAALVGATVGSQVLVVIPPDQGYGEAGQPSANISGTDDLVFVIDILQTTPAQ